MRLSRPRRRGTGDDAMLPLINIVFLLLIFFMIAGRLSSHDPFDVTPPQSASNEPPQAESMTLLMARDGAIALDGRPLSRNELAAKLQERRAAGRLGPLRLRADAASNTPEVVALMELLRDNGIERLHLITQKTGASLR